MLLAAAMLARAEEALEVLRKTAETYKSAKSWALESVDKLEQATRGQQRTVTRPFHAWRLGNTMRVDFADGSARLTDGHFEWSSPAGSNTFTRKPAPWDSRGRLALQAYFYDFEGIADFVKTAGFIAPPGKDGFLIEVTYGLPGRVATEVTKNYWIDARNYTVLRETSNPTVMTDSSFSGPVKLTRTITFSKADLDAPVEASKLAVPPGEVR
jgi:hypothetical protein